MNPKLSLGLLILITTATACQSRQSCCEVIDQTYIHKYGVQVAPDEWAERGQQGTVVTTRADGVTVENSYSRGTLHGDTTYTFPHSSQIQKRETYQQGQLVGEIVFNYSGTPERQFVIQPENGMRKTTIWYDDATPMSVETYNGTFLVEGEYYTPNHQRDSLVFNSEGTRNIRDNFGHLIASEVIQRGMPTSRTTYYPNGAPKESVTLRNGQIDGERRTFNPGGDPLALEHWTNGVQHGIATFYNNGEKVADVPYENGVRNGVEKHYRDGTVVVIEISWQDDMRHGPSNTYYGEKNVTEWYYEGAPVSKSKYDLLTSRSLNAKAA